MTVLIIIGVVITCVVIAILGQLMTAVFFVSIVSSTVAGFNKAGKDSLKNRELSGLEDELDD